MTFNNALNSQTADIQAGRGLSFYVSTYTTGTLTQSGTLVTFTSSPGSAASGGYCVPASGSPFYLIQYNGGTFNADISQTIAAGTSFTLYFFDNTTTAGQLTQQQRASQTLFPNFQRITIGSGSGAALSLWNHAGSMAFGNGAAFGTGSTAILTSGNPVASQTGTTVTATSSVFSASSVGRLIRFSQGYTCFITGFTSATVVTVDVSQTVPLQQFFVVGSGSNEGVSIGPRGQVGAASVYAKTAFYTQGGVFMQPTSVTGATYNVLATDYYLACNRAGTIALTFPTATGSGRVIVVKDVSGAALSNNITATSSGATFDGVSTLTINTNYGFVTCTDTATNVWSLS